MAFLDLDTNFITQKTLEELAQRTNVTYLSPGAKVRLILDIVNDKLGQQANQFDLNTGRAFIRNADGALLDYVGEIFGTQRELSQKSEISSEEKNFYFYTLESDFGSINLGQDIIIPAGGVRIFNSSRNDVKQVVYINTEDIILTGSESRVYFSAEAEGLGADYNIGSNTLTQHDFRGYADALNRSLLVSNDSAITYGESEESDENYRFRIQQQAISGEAANFSAIRLAILAVPGVSDVVRIRYPRGIGTADWLIKAVTPEVPGRLISTCQSAISEVEGSGLENLAKAPVTIGTQLIFALTYRTQLEENVKTQIKTEVRKNLINYINNLGIGERLVIDQLKRIILNADNRIESIGEEGSSADFSKINIFKRSAISDSVVRRTIIDTYRTKSNERVIVEPTISAPIVITDNN
jgi:uncharacterized phage protein gp47/JayE